MSAMITGAPEAASFGSAEAAEVFAGEHGGVQVGFQIILSIMVCWDGVLLAAFLMEAEVPALAALEVVLDVQSALGILKRVP